jgi:hypothetical protein
VLHIFTYFPSSHILSCRPITAYCFGSLGIYSKSQSIIGIYRFHFIFLCFLPLGRANVSYGFFKLGEITLHLNFANIDFIIIRNIWFSYSLRLSVASATCISWPLLPKDNCFYKVLCNKILVYIIHPPCGVRFLYTMLPQIVSSLIFLFWVQSAKTLMVHLASMVHLALHLKLWTRPVWILADYAIFLLEL